MSRQLMGQLRQPSESQVIQTGKRIDLCGPTTGASGRTSILSEQGPGIGRHWIVPKPALQRACQRLAWSGCLAGWDDRAFPEEDGVDEFAELRIDIAKLANLRAMNRSERSRGTGTTLATSFLHDAQTAPLPFRGP